MDGFIKKGRLEALSGKQHWFMCRKKRAKGNGVIEHAFMACMRIRIPGLKEIEETYFVLKEC